MNTKECIIHLLDEVPDYKLGYVLAYVQGLIVADDADILAASSRLLQQNQHTYEELAR